MIFKTGLFFHMIGIFLLAGGSIGTIITESLFWKHIRSGSDKAKVIMPLLLLFPRVIIAGAILMLFSGVTMLYGTNWLFWGQSWLTIKLILFVLLVLNGRLVGKGLFSKIAHEIQFPEYKSARLLSLKVGITRFHVIQFFMLLSLMALVIFKH